MPENGHGSGRWFCGHAGYRQACEAAKERLELLALNHSSNEDTFRQDLLNIAKTTLRCTTSSSKASASPVVVCCLALMLQLQSVGMTFDCVVAMYA